MELLMHATQTSQDISDAELLMQHLAGQADAFAALTRRYQRELYAFLARFTGDSALAEDVFQETFLQVYQSAGSFDTSRRFRPWLYTVAINKARDALRKKRRHPAAPLDAIISSQGGRQTSYSDLMSSNIPSPDEISVNLETRQAVQTIVEEMPESLRQILIMSYFNELPHKEIAEALSIPVGTVKSRLHTAVKYFAEKWKIWVKKQAVSDDGASAYDGTNETR
jgi:RNA polymerase sigma-70 factor (ECF subfamily)